MINENITLAFENCKLERRPALLTYIVAGDSNKKMTLDILKSISPFVDIC
jgi:tryptophan synthase alpha chain